MAGGAWPAGRLAKSGDPFSVMVATMQSSPRQVGAKMGAVRLSPISVGRAVSAVRARVGSAGGQTFGRGNFRLSRGRGKNGRGWFPGHGQGARSSHVS